MSVRENLIDIGEIIETPNGVVHRRTYMVSDLEGPPDDRMCQALDEKGIPKKNEPHRSIPGLQVVERHVSPVPGSPTRMRVQVTWGSPPTGEGGVLSPRNASGVGASERGDTVWSGRPGSVTVMTTDDAGGQPMLIPYRGQPSTHTYSLSQYAAVAQQWANYFEAKTLVSAEKSVPTISLTGSRWERDPPEATAIQFGGKVNSSRFRAFPRGSLLSTGLAWQTDPAGGYRVDYNFTYNPDGWMLTQTIKIEGRLPIDVTNDNGRRTFRIYAFDDFRRYEL